MQLLIPRERGHEVFSRGRVAVGAEHWDLHPDPPLIWRGRRYSMSILN